MADKSKGLLALMVGSPKKGEPTEGGGSSKVDAVRDFFTAGKRGDYEEAAAAFERAYDACAGMGEDEPEEDEPIEEE